MPKLPPIGVYSAATGGNDDYVCTADDAAAYAGVSCLGATLTGTAIFVDVTGSDTYTIARTSTGWRSVA